MEIFALGAKRQHVGEELPEPGGEMPEADDDYHPSAAEIAQLDFERF
jgi:hypothetical protein